MTTFQRTLPALSAYTTFCVALSVSAIVSDGVRPLAAQDGPILRSRLGMESASSQQCEAVINSAIGASWRLARVQLLTTPVSANAPMRMPSPVVGVDIGTSLRRRWSVRASATAGAADAQCASQSQNTRGWIEVTRALSRGGVSLAFGEQSFSSLDPSRDREGFTVALWQQIGQSRLSVDVRTQRVGGYSTAHFMSTLTRADSIRVDSAPGGWVRFNRTETVPDSARTQQRASTVDVRTRWQRDIGRLALDFTLGGSGVVAPNAVIDSAGRQFGARGSNWPSFKTQFWMRADAAIPVASQIRLLFSAALLPARPFVSRERSRVATLGFSISTAPALAKSDSVADMNRHGSTGFFVHTIGADDSLHTDALATGSDSITVRIRVRAAQAKAVELSGEQFQWRPLTMRAAGGGWWELTVRVRPGTYRMSMRLDNTKWIAPPGLPRLHDEFGGDVALVTMK